MRRTVFLLSSSWRSFSFKYTVIHVPGFFQVMHFSVLFQALDTSVIVLGLHLCASMVCSLWEKENQVVRCILHGPGILI